MEEIDVFLELSCFFCDPADLGDLWSTYINLNGGTNQKPMIDTKRKELQKKITKSQQGQVKKMKFRKNNSVQNNLRTRHKKVRSIYQ